MSKTFEEVRDLLSQKFSREKKRLKTFNTKVSSFDLAHATARFVMALMADSRNRELVRFRKYLIRKVKRHRHVPFEYITSYLQERLKATSDMAKAIQHMAEDTEKKRPWRSENEQKIIKEEKRQKHNHRKRK